MWKYIKQYLLIKGARSTSEEVLATQEKVDEFSEVWDNNQEGLMLISASLMHNFVTRNDFNKEDLEMYKRGLTDFALFFEQCSVDRKKRINESLKSTTQHDDDMI